MSRYLLLAAFLAAAGIAPALADPCFMTTVTISGGPYLILGTGIKYTPYPGRDNVAAGQWIPLDKVQVCHLSGSVDLITNLSRPPHQTIKAIRRFP